MVAPSTDSCVVQCAVMCIATDSEGEALLHSILDILYTSSESSVQIILFYYVYKVLLWLTCTCMCLYVHVYKVLL